MEKKEEKIVMTLGIVGEEKKMYGQHQPAPVAEKDPYAPHIAVVAEAYAAPVAKVEEPKPRNARAARFYSRA